MLFEFFKNHPGALLSVMLTVLVVCIRLFLLLRELRDLPTTAGSASSSPFKKYNTYKRTFSDAA